MTVGTCRVWRGSTEGANFAALSPNFDTGSASGCTGAETNMVRALAAGGPLDGQKVSRMIYAGTNGTGPLAGTPAGGRVWAISEASDGSITAADVTGAINPQHFPVSAVAVDPSDTSGRTAYVALMGFGAAHVWQTTNAGQSWNDFSGTLLPDAPANSLLLDGGNLYVGTDVGVFVTATGGPAPNWSEVGPAPGASGFLPDVPVTALAMFNNGSTKILRAATYGRGVWQLPLTTNPDFAIAMENPSQTIFAGLTASFSGAMSAFNGFSDAVSLSCAGASLPATCRFDPAQISPARATTSFQLTANGAVGDYAFAAQGSGGSLTRSAQLTLHVVDFQLSSPAPASVNVALGATSAPVTMQVSFLGSFPTGGAVALSCAAPTGVSCTFFPSPSLSRPVSGPATVTLTIAAGATAAFGSTAIDISASSSDAGSKTVHQALTVNITNSQDYAISLGSPPNFTPAGQTLTLQGTLTSLNGYGSKVQLSCVAAASAPPPVCAVSPAGLTPASGGAGFTLSVSSNTGTAFAFLVKATGTDADQTTHSAPVAVNFFDFSVGPSGLSQTVKAGQSASYTLQFTPQGLATFPAAVTYTCSSLPNLSTCLFSPAQINSGAGVSPVTLTVSTTAAVARLGAPGRPNRTLFLALGLPLAGMLLAGGKRMRVAGAMAVMLILMLPACGGGLTGGGSINPAQPGTPAGSYPVIVTATAGAGTAAQSQQISVTLVVH
jgi:hypothetical protein